jgi:hypothetical protein
VVDVVVEVEVDLGLRWVVTMTRDGGRLALGFQISGNAGSSTTKQNDLLNHQLAIGGYSVTSLLVITSGGSPVHHLPRQPQFSRCVVGCTRVKTTIHS